MPGYFDFFPKLPKFLANMNPSMLKKLQGDELIFHVTTSSTFIESNRDRCDIALSSCLMPARRASAE
jgi:hypothetical protein